MFCNDKFDDCNGYECFFEYGIDAFGNKAEEANNKATASAYRYKHWNKKIPTKKPLNEHMQKPQLRPRTKPRHKPWGQPTIKPRKKYCQTSKGQIQLPSPGHCSLVLKNENYIQSPISNFGPITICQLNSHKAKQERCCYHSKEHTTPNRLDNDQKGFSH